MEAKGKGATEDSWDSVQVGGAAGEGSVLDVRRTVVERGQAGRGIARRTIATRRDGHAAGRVGSTLGRVGSTAERAGSAAGRTDFAVGRGTRAGSTSAAAGRGNTAGSSSVVAAAKTGRARSGAGGRTGKAGSTTATRGAHLLREMLHLHLQGLVLLLEELLLGVGGVDSCNLKGL
ncbi:hypothetical protein COCNU_11G007050 [Cocos nucifera]|uniref:Uncharacterized protein n=1 Tax=Cocos nucifera TaxID=13894 RepID=A0A8K0N9I1_COCNU|nr:hypothetical protein COCNU_11G007050 [Cocos nucifera]